MGEKKFSEKPSQQGSFTESSPRRNGYKTKKRKEEKNRKMVSSGEKEGKNSSRNSEPGPSELTKEVVGLVLHSEQTGGKGKRKT